MHACVAVSVLSHCWNTYESVCAWKFDNRTGNRSCQDIILHLPTG